MCAAFTGEASLVCLMILCSPWQSVHSGAWVMPLASAWPCTLARYCSTTSLWHMPQVSGTAMRKRLRLGGQQLVRAAVAQGAIGRAFVAALRAMAVHAAGVVAGLVLWQVTHCGLGILAGCGILLVRVVAGVAGQPLVSALLQFLPLIVAGSALRGRRRLSAAYAVAPAAPSNKANKGGTEPSARSMIMPGSSSYYTPMLLFWTQLCQTYSPPRITP